MKEVMFVDIYIISGSSYHPPRWEFCTSLLYKTLPLAVNAIVENCTDRQINNDFKHNRIQNMFTAIKISTKNKIKKAHWINRVLKTHLLQKVPYSYNLGSLNITMVNIIYHSKVNNARKWSYLFSGLKEAETLKTFFVV